MQKKNIYYNIDIDTLKNNIRDKNINDILLNNILHEFQLALINENKYKIEKSIFSSNIFYIFFDFYKLFDIIM